MALFGNTSFKIMEQGLDNVWYKQKIISQNIANVSTPNYKAKTVTFGAVLKDKCRCRYHAAQQDGTRLDMTVHVTEEPNTTQRLDGNNVDMEKEAVALSDAQYQYSTLIDKTINEFNMIRTAIQK